MFLKNVSLQLPSVSAEGFEEGIVSLADPEHSWANSGISGTAYSLFSYSSHTSSTLCSNAKVTNTSETSLKKSSFLYFSLQVSLLLAKEAVWGWTDFVTWPNLSCLSLKPAAETLAVWLKTPTQISTWFHGPFLFTPLEWRLGYFPRSIFCFAPCSVQLWEGGILHRKLILFSFHTPKNDLGKQKIQIEE